MSFEQKVHELAEKGFLHMLSQGSWVQPDYAHRVQIPKDLMEQVWALVNQKELKKKLAGRIESELADRIVNAIAAEIATDIKSILSVPERREMLRSLARQHLTAIMKAGQ